MHPWGDRSMFAGSDGDRRTTEGGSEARVALVGGVYEQRRLLDQLVRGLGGRLLAPLLMRAKEVVGEFSPREGVEEQAGVIEVLTELGDDLVAFGADVGVLLAAECSRASEHGGEGARRG